jgi:hypothetical protein
MKNKGNSDPEFDKIIGKRTPEERSFLFVICVITRFLLYSAVYAYRDSPWIPYIVGVASSASVYQLTKPTENRQWWSKKFQLIMAVLILISCFAVKFLNLDTKVIPGLLFISLFGGIIQRSQVTLQSSSGT